MLHRTEVFEEERSLSLGWTVRLTVLTLALIGLSVFVYWESLWDLFISILHREGSSHGLFVPFISGYFLWLKRERLRHLEPCLSLLPGAAVVSGGLLVLYISRRSPEVTFAALSLVLVAFGLVIALFGVKVFKEIAFPLLFLVTMIPLPQTIYNQIGEWMRKMSTSGSVWLVHLVHLPLYREGYNIQLSTSNLFIDTSCSGIRYLLSFFVFSLAYAFLCKKGIKARSLVVLASFPIAVVAGVLRLFTIYLSVYFIGSFMAEKRPHILVSWSVFLVVLVAAILVDQSLSKWRRQQSA